MKMPPSLLGTVITATLAGGAPLSPSSAAAPETTRPFGDPASVAYARALWSALRDADLVGPASLATVPYVGQHPHGAVLETFYDDVSVRGHRGEVIVKKNYAGEGLTSSAVARDRGAHLASVTVMFKREQGYDPDHRDWFWVKYAPDGRLRTNPAGVRLAGRVAKGTDSGCIACHQAQEQSDYQFNTTSFIDAE